MTKDYKPEPRIKPPVKKERKPKTNEFLFQEEEEEEETSFWELEERKAKEENS